MNGLVFATYFYLFSDGRLLRELSVFGRSFSVTSILASSSAKFMLVLLLLRWLNFFILAILVRDSLFDILSSKI
jgi:hypothetical protein